MPSVPDHQNTPATALARLATRFPLVLRGRPAARALPERIDEVHRLAHQPPTTTGRDHVARVAQALNKAALIASDCALPDLARELCWRQFTVLHAAAPLPAMLAQYALEPLVNLGRLATRRGDGSTAYRLYQDTFHAVTTGSRATIDGRDVDFGTLVQRPDERQEQHRFLRAVLLADGTRALTSAGRWDGILAHLERYDGIGDRLLDGRQVAVLAHAVHGDTEQALALLDASVTPVPWEHAVAACLRTLCMRLAGCTSHTAVTAMIDAFREVPPRIEAVVVHIRLGLCVAELADATNPAASQKITAGLVRLTARAHDAHAAADLLAYCPPGLHTEADKEVLTNTIEAAGLKQRTMPPNLSNTLAAAVDYALTMVAALLADGHGVDEPHASRKS